MLDALNDGKVHKIFDAIEGIDIEKAQASKDEDKWNIMEMVKKEDGGAEKVNNDVKGVCRDWVNSVIAELVEEEVTSSDDATTDTKLASLFHSVGSSYNKQEKYDVALQYYEKCRAIRESAPGSNQPALSNTYNSIAGVYSHQGEYEQALKYYNKCRVIKEKVLGRFHPHLAATYGNIGSVYRKQDKYEEALKSYEKSVQIQEQVCGFHHPSLATTYYNIGLLYKNQNGMKSDALEYLRKALKIYEVSLGENDAKTKKVQNKITEVEAL